MENKQTKRDYIRNYIIENDLFTKPSRTLAKIILAANPALFGKFNDKNIDNIRTYIRTIRHRHGQEMVTEDKLFAEKFGGYLEPDINDYTPFVIPKEVTRLGIMNDIHFPFHHKKNLNAAVDYLQSKECNGILLNGDIIDCYKGSVFLKDPRMRDIVDEMNILREFIDTLNHKMGCPIFYKLGNHEERIELNVMRSVPELVHFVTFESCLSDNGNFDFDEYKLTVIKDKRIVKFTDNLSILHGHEYRTGMFNPVGVARWLFTKAKANAACGHAHKNSSYSEPTIENHIVETNSIGCLCDMHPKYMPLNFWSAGFAYVRRIENNNFKFSNLIIQDGVVF